MKPRTEPLTDEDRAAWFDWQVNRRRDWALWGALERLSFAADSRDAKLMFLREHAKASTSEAWEDWATHRREWFPSGWGLA